jgi:hypothetical protein
MAKQKRQAMTRRQTGRLSFTKQFPPMDVAIDVPSGEKRKGAKMTQRRKGSIRKNLRRVFA